ncbi:leucine-rich repeat-containing protein 3B-like [Saccostrea cucullata]|uniref:leucine-rich repeat-containing protein 3B-like n=1 Tax=Saccostrea cuccullata TaxID=36930 RepID=UPI002ED67733
MTLIVWTLVLCVLMYGPVTEACPSGCSCWRSSDCNGTFVDCEKRGLTDVPTNISTDTCYLSLGYNQITSIPDNAFNGLPNLQTLYLQVNKITSIPDNAFNGLQNLQTLYLHVNQITSIPDNAFNGLPNLQTL